MISLSVVFWGHRGAVATSKLIYKSMPGWSTTRRPELVKRAETRREIPYL
jgi:hypothetical protein